jgi:hypothetical protein
LSGTAFLKQRIRKRWKLLVIVAGLWLFALFPIPFLPLFHAPFDDTSIKISIMIIGIASIPFTLLALFMNSGRRVDLPAEEGDL